MATHQIVDESFPVPGSLVTAGFRLELLGPQHNTADHAAWMSSIDHIRRTPGFGGSWPPPSGMTLAENLADLESHADRSARRIDFAYTVLDATTGEVIGCVYFKPVEVAHEEQTRRLGDDAVESSGSGIADPSTQAGHAANPPRSNESTSEPADPAEPAKAAGPAKPVEPAKTARPAELAELAEPARIVVEALSWVRADRAALDGPLTEAVGAWILTEWPFRTIRYRLGPAPMTINLD